MAKRQSRYPQSVIVYAVAGRTRGMSWDNIREEIENRFQIKAPTDRSMREWMKSSTQERLRPKDHVVQTVDMVISRRLTETYKDTQQEVGKLNGILLTNICLDQLKVVDEALKSDKDPIIAAGADIIRRMAEIAGIARVNEMIEEYRRMEALKAKAQDRAAEK